MANLPQTAGATAAVILIVGVVTAFTYRPTPKPDADLLRDPRYQENQLIIDCMKQLVDNLVGQADPSNTPTRSNSNAKTTDLTVHLRGCNAADNNPIDRPGLENAGGKPAPSEEPRTN